MNETKLGIIGVNCEFVWISMIELVEYATVNELIVNYWCVHEFLDREG